VQWDLKKQTRRCLQTSGANLGPMMAAMMSATLISRIESTWNYAANPPSKPLQLKNLI
jgi:hypothetical protein